MKIIHLISGGDVGGAKTHVLTLLHGLGKKNTVRLVCFMEGAFSQEARELGIDTVTMTSRNIPALVKNLIAMINGEGFQVVHCHGSRANMIGAMLQSRVQAPVISTVHSDYKLDYLGRPLHHLTYGTINRICVRRIKNHIGVSDAISEMLISRGFDPQTMYSIYNGVDFTPVQVRLNREEYLQSVGLKAEEGDVIFGIAARLSPVKDVGTLIKGFGMACKQTKHIKLVIAGDGEQRQELEALAKSCCPEGSYAFAGWVDDTDSFYHAIDVNTLTSLSEAFPYALTEGARMHCATIASRVGGVPKLIEHGVYGLLFEARDTEKLAEYIVRLAEDSQLRLKLGEALYQKASTEFSIEATVRHQEEIYADLLRRVNRKPGKRDGVLICGAYGKGNAGDDSILEAILTQIRRIDPDLPVYVLSRNPKETRIRYRIGAIHTFDIPGFFYRMRKTRLYINGGGTLIQDVTSTRSLQYYLSNIALAKRCGNQVIMYGCGIGPVSAPKNRAQAKKVINRYVDMITLRDPQSRDELKNMGITKPEIRLTADPALMLDAASDSAVDSLLLSNGIAPEGTYALFVLRPWKGVEQAVPAFVEAAEQLYARHGIVPVFFALEPGRDLQISRETAEKVQCPHYVLAAPDDGKRIVGLMKQMKLVISMRLHALIFAAGQGTPLVGVVYDPKVSGFLDYVGQKRYVDVQDVTAEKLLVMAEDALSQGVDLGNAQQLRALAEENESAARELLKKGR